MLSQALTRLLAGVLDSSLSGSQTCDRHTERRAADVVQANIVAELDAGGIATGRMVKDAEALGADAIVGMRYASASVMQGAAEVIAYGTAVKFV